MNWNKNVVALAESCIKLQYPLVVVGKQAVAQDVDPLHPWNKELIQFQELAKQHSDIIRCLGFVETSELVGLYNLATMLAQPAIAEGFGLPVVEALNCGCPVIISNRSSLPEITEDAALQIDPTNQAEIEEAIDTLMKNEQLRKDLQEKGLKRAKKFSWEKPCKPST